MHPSIVSEEPQDSEEGTHRMQMGLVPKAHDIHPGHPGQQIPPDVANQSIAALSALSPHQSTGALLFWSKETFVTPHFYFDFMASYPHCHLQSLDYFFPNIRSNKNQVI